MIDPDAFLIIEARAENGLRFFVERDRAACDRASIVTALLNGEPAYPLIIYECNPVDKTCYNVSSDLAREVAMRAYEQHMRVSAGLLDFLEHQLGIGQTPKLTLVA